MVISNMLKEKRKEYQLTQEQLAEKIYVSNKTISNWETGKTKPDIESLILLAKLFDLSLDNLLLEGSDMVKSMDKDIKKGRNLKKILTLVILPLIIIIICLSWVTYKGSHKSIVPLSDISNIDVDTEQLTGTTKITGDVSLGKFESVDLIDAVIENDTLYLMIYKEPKLIFRKSDFTIDLNDEFKNRDTTVADIDKIVLTYWDTTRLNGYDKRQLTEDFPQKEVWKR